MELKELLPLLVASKVTKFKDKEYEIELYPHSASEKDAQPSNSVEELKKLVAAQEASLPEGLRADDLMNEDKIRDWSAPAAPDEDVAPVALTGDAPLDEVAQ